MVFVPIQKLESGLSGFWGVDIGRAYWEQAGRILRQKGSWNSLNTSSVFPFCGPFIKQQAIIRPKDLSQRLCHQSYVLTLQLFSAQLTRCDLHIADIFYETGREHCKKSILVSACLHSVECRMVNPRTGEFWPKTPHIYINANTFI